MGRGRAKAKQTKVARDLKYFSPNTDLTALQRELHGGSPDEPDAPDEADEAKPVDDEDDDYQQWATGQR